MRRAPAFWHDRNHPAGLILTPAGWVWTAVTQLRRCLIPARVAPIPTLCIGNVTAGGSGKTPTALAIARLLQARGNHPAFGTRGYGAALASDDVLRVDPKQHNAAQVGDEALLLAAAAPCYLGRDRYALAEAAQAEGASHIVFDDGLQNPQLDYHRALVVIDGAYGLGNGRIIPAGPLRETLASALERSAALLLIGADQYGIGAACTKLTHGRVPVLQADLQPDLAGILLARPYYAFAGIGRPEKFFATCQAAGLSLSGTRSFGDHHAFTNRELVEMAQTAATQGAALLTTAKDAARLSSAWRAQVTVLPVTLRFADPAQLLACVLD
jgi:tetraacyldisaccharide 4'-kinase